MRGATDYRGEVCMLYKDISIHAPHAGSDFSPRLRNTYREFQSTLPMRGATEIAPELDTMD